MMILDEAAKMIDKMKSVIPVGYQRDGDDLKFKKRRS